jgi:hypothetical protein
MAYYLIVVVSRFLLFAHLSYSFILLTVYVILLSPACCRAMEEDQSAVLVAEGSIKSIKLSLSTEAEIVCSPFLMVLLVILACRDAC